MLWLWEDNKKVKWVSLNKQNKKMKSAFDSDFRNTS